VTRPRALLAAALVAGALTACATGAQSPPSPPAPSVETLLVAERTTIGQDIVYPAGPGKVTAEIVTLPRGASTSLHLHAVPMFAYILEGQLVVEYEGVGEKRYRKGDVFVEAIDVAHRGRAAIRGNARKVKILVVYAGAAGTPNSEVIEP
jgi:quercetin dioxygenase-like cupin family protein